MTSSEPTLTAFLEALYPDFGPGDLLELRRIKTLPDGRKKSSSQFFNSISGFVKAVPKSLSEQEGYDIYFGVCLRSRCKGDKQSIQRAHSLWCDIDFKAYAGGEAEARGALKALQLPPSTISASGGGLHAYWFLREALVIESEQDSNDFKRHLKALAMALGADLQSTDIPRVLRVPGTFNLKYDPPRLVNIDTFDSQRRCNVCDSDFLLDLVEPTGSGAAPYTSGNPPGWIGPALAGLEDGNRNDTFAKVIGRLHRDGWQPKDILELLKPHARDAGFPEPEMEGEIKGICGRYPQPPDSDKECQTPAPSASTAKSDHSRAAQLLKLVEAEDLVLFHDQFDDAHVVLANSPKRVMKVNSKVCRQWLARLSWQKTGHPVSRESLQSVLQVLEGKAKFEGQRVELRVRVAWNEDELYYDLGYGSAVRIAADGWHITEDFPTLFRRLPHQRPQVIPVASGSLNQILPFLNLPSDGHTRDRQLLLMVWLVTSFIPGFPHPVLVAHGPQGASKSTLFRIVKELLDPSAIQTLSPTGSLRDLVLQASSHWFLPLDNLSSLPVWMSDALSRACSGDGFSTRELYSDADEVILAFQRVIGLNGIALVVDKPDLLDRSLLLPLERIPETRRMSEADFWERFNQVKPRLLGAIFDALSIALRIRPSVELPLLPRMADFALWGVAVAEALGFGRDRFLAAYGHVIAAQNQEALDASSVAQALLSLMERRDEWIGTPSQLLAALNVEAEGLSIDTHGRSWPKSSSWLWRRLREAQTNLEAVGMTIERSEGTSRLITIHKCTGNAVDAGVAEVIKGLPA